MFQFTGLIRGPTRKRRSNGTDYGVSIHRPHTRPDEQFFIREFGRDGVSIHRPHTRPDVPAPIRRKAYSRFNSQASYEARRCRCIVDIIALLFQFTGLIRGPTKRRPPRRRHARRFNSQASYEARLLIRSATSLIESFNSQASYEARRVSPVVVLMNLMFQFTGLIRGPTAWAIDLLATLESFNSQASYEARLRSS